MIRNIEPGDAEQICRIYNYYIENTIITFEEISVSGEQMKERIKEITDSYPWLVYEENGIISGYAYAGRWKSRCAYRYSVESTVYIEKDRTGRGMGSVLYTELIDRLRELNLHSVLGGIALPNPASVALHEKFGFKKAAHFTQTGFKFEKWIDVGYWELLLL
jgi:phosphinothricin acetyltransferase